MQDRYAGDLGDFFKLGLLRWLMAGPRGEQPLSLGVVWYLVANEAHNLDGKHVAYLEPGHPAGRGLRALDQALFDALTSVVQQGNRSVAALERAGALPPGSRTYRDVLDFGDLPNASRAEHRRAWLRRALAATVGCDAVFIDPDNGLRPSGHRNPRHRSEAVKHAYIDELMPFIDRGQSLVAYHHADRSAPVEIQAARRLDDLAAELSSEPLCAVRASRGSTRLFLVISAPAHLQRLTERLTALEESQWRRELTVYWRRPTEPPREGRAKVLAIPDFQTLMRPILAAHEDQAEWDGASLLERLAEEFDLTPQERAAMLPSGRQRSFDNRVAWSKTHLSQAGLLERPRRGITRLTERGYDVLSKHPQRVDMSVLNEFEAYRNFRRRSRQEAPQIAEADETLLSDPIEVARTPEELWRLPARGRPTARPDR